MGFTGPEGIKVYTRQVIANNLERCQDVIWDLKNKPEFDKNDGSVLGVIAVCEQIEVSLAALMVDLQ